MKHIQTLQLLLLAVFFLSGNTLVFGRTFRTMAGVPIEASLVGVKTSKTNKIVVLKLDRTGRPYEIPLARFSFPDKQFIKSSDVFKRATVSGSKSTGNVAGIPPKSTLPLPSGRSVFLELGSKLVVIDGAGVKNHKLGEQPDYYAFYFAAAWCPPCRRFTPRLAKYYMNNISFANPKFEVIFVSRDNSKSEMEDYMLKSGMPWPAIRYSASVREQLIKKYAPSGTPNLVLVDRAGKVISESFVDGNPRGAFAVKQDIAFWFTGGERTAGGIIKSKLTSDKRVSD